MKLGFKSIAVNAVGVFSAFFALQGCIGNVQDDFVGEYEPMSVAPESDFQATQQGSFYCKVDSGSEPLASDSPRACTQDYIQSNQGGFVSEQSRPLVKFAGLGKSIKIGRVYHYADTSTVCAISGELSNACFNANEANRSGQRVAEHGWKVELEGGTSFFISDSDQRPENLAAFGQPLLRAPVDTGFGVDCTVVDRAYLCNCTWQIDASVQLRSLDSETLQLSVRVKSDTFGVNQTLPGTIVRQGCSVPVQQWFTRVDPRYFNRNEWMVVQFKKRPGSGSSVETEVPQGFTNTLPADALKTWVQFDRL